MYFILCARAAFCYSSLLCTISSSPSVKLISARSAVISFEMPMGKFALISPFSSEYFTPLSVSPRTCGAHAKTDSE